MAHYKFDCSKEVGGGGGGLKERLQCTDYHVLFLTYETFNPLTPRSNRLYKFSLQFQYTVKLTGNEN